MSFVFGSQPAPANSPFGQAPAFGAQQTFGAPPAPTNTVQQFGSPFGTGQPQTGVQFVSPTSAPPMFGQTQPFGFGAATSTSGNTFGTSNLFGTTAPSGGLTFGPAATAATFGGTGRSFAAPSTAASVFGTTASVAPSFGFGNTFANPASTQTTGLTFGSSVTTPSTGFRLGAPVSTGLTYGTPAVPSTGVAFGNAPAQSALATGLTFGSVGATLPAFGASTNTGLNFGNTPATTNVAFGTSAPFNSAPTTRPSVPLTGTASTPNVSFGTAVPLNFGNTSATTGITFGTPSTTSSAFTTPTATNTAASTGLTFSTPTTNSGLSFGTPAATTTTSLNFGAKPIGGLTLGTSTLSVGATGTTSTAPSTALTFNTTAPAASTAAPFSTLGISTSIPETTGSLGLGGITALKPQSTTPQQIGLGGISTASPKQPVNLSNTTQAELPPKDQPLPNELLQTVEQFKAFLKDQKLNSSEIARFSTKELKTVDANITGISNVICEMESESQKNKCMAEKLKVETAQALQYAEMAQRTFEIPSGMQYDNTAPISFFMQLLYNFERDLQQLKFQLENLNKQVQHHKLPAALTSEDLALGLRRLHQTFVSLAGRLQNIHYQVEVQKERYLSLRKQKFNDDTNVFEDQNKEMEALEYALKSIASTNNFPEALTGPSPFNSLGTGQAQLLAQNPPPIYPSIPTIGQTTIGTSLPGSQPPALFGPTLGSSTMSIFHSSASNQFQLQKPPTGSKRGKM